MTENALPPEPGTVPNPSLGYQLLNPPLPSPPSNDQELGDAEFEEGDDDEDVAYS